MACLCSTGLLLACVSSTWRCKKACWPVFDLPCAVSPLWIRFAEADWWFRFAVVVSGLWRRTRVYIKSRDYSVRIGPWISVLLLFRFLYMLRQNLSLYDSCTWCWAIRVAAGHLFVYDPSTWCFLFDNFHVTWCWRKSPPFSVFFKLPCTWCWGLRVVAGLYLFFFLDRKSVV